MDHEGEQGGTASKALKGGVVSFPTGGFLALVSIG